MKSSIFFQFAILTLISSTSALWTIKAVVTLPGLCATGFTCSSESTTTASGIDSGIAAPPVCAINITEAVLNAAMSATNAGRTAGVAGGRTRSDGGEVSSVAHFIPNGTVYNYLNTVALKVDEWHSVVSNGQELQASKHTAGFNILRGSVSAQSSTDPNAIEDMSAQFGNRKWPVANRWREDELRNMAVEILETQDLNAVQMCSTVFDDTDADTFDMSWIFETLNRPYTEIPPPCGVEDVG